ncbi:ABC transporter substrate-binding protein [Candidatus Gracilibacteria bacterium]|nr:ABC transporter substrate-binding protein [Candidatus Gracilibacteria bacterium]
MKTWKIVVAAILIAGVAIGFFFYQKEQNKLLFVTEHYPPFAYLTDTGEVTGLSVSIVREIQSRLGMDESITLGLWSDAYGLATHRKNVVIFSIRRTPNRESIFHWVGPIARTKNVFYARKGSGLQFDVLEDVKTVPHVGVIASWFNAQNLESAGFTNLVKVDTPEELIRKLMNGEADVIAMTDVSMVDYLEENGYTMDDIEQVLWIDGGYDYIGFSQGTDIEIVQQWKDVLNEIKADGTFKSLYEKYQPGSDLADLLNL